MLFMVSWSISPQNRNSVIKRFLETQGAPPPASKCLGAGMPSEARAVLASPKPTMSYRFKRGCCNGMT